MLSLVMRRNSFCFEVVSRAGVQTLSEGLVCGLALDAIGREDFLANVESWREGLKRLVAVRRQELLLQVHLLARVVTRWQSGDRVVIVVNAGHFLALDFSNLFSVFHDLLLLESKLHLSWLLGVVNQRLVCFCVGLIQSVVNF